MVQPVSSSNINNQIVNDALNVQAQLAVTETQQASGLQAQDFGTLGGAASREVLNFQTDIAQAQNWATDAQTAGSTTQAAFNAVGNISSVINKLQALISQATSSPDNSDLLSQAQSLQASLLSQVNQQVGGSFIFAGSNTAVAPVSLANYPTLSATTNAYDPNTPDTGYYTGDQTIQSVQVSLQQTVSYGVTASNPALEEAMRAVQSVIEAAQVTNASTTTATSGSVATAVGGGTLTVNGQNFTITGGQSLDQIAQSINSQAAGTGSGITAQVLPDTSGAFHLQIADGSNALNVTDGSGLGLTSTAATTTPQLNAALATSLTISNQAVTDLGNLQENISNSSNQLSQAQTQQTSFVTFLENSLSDVKDADTAQTAAQAQQFQTQLQASFLAVATLNKLSLAQFL